MQTEKKKKYIKEIKVSSLAMKFDESLLDLRDENGRICCCVDVCYREKRETEKQKRCECFINISVLNNSKKKRKKQ